MRRFWAIITIFLAGLSAAAGGAGLYTGWREVFGIHFMADNGWRMSVGLMPAESGSSTPSVALSLDAVFASGLAYAGDAEMPTLDYYAGAGVTASLLKSSPELNGHAMLGLEAFFPQAGNVGFFGELQLGQRFLFSPFATTPFIGFRLGLTLH